MHSNYNRVAKAAPLLILLAAAACARQLPIVDEDPDSEAVHAATGAAGGQAQSGRAGQTSQPNGAAEGCDPAQAPKIIYSAMGKRSYLMELAGNQILFIDWDENAIHAIALDGSNNTVFYRPDSGVTLGSFVVGTDAVFVMLSELAANRSFLLSIPLTGGAATPVPGAAQKLVYVPASVFATDEQYVYVLEGTEIIRLAKTTGDRAVIGDTHGTRFSGLILYGNKIWWASTSDIENVPVDGTNVKPTVYARTACLDVFAVNAGGVFCGGERIESNGMTTSVRSMLGSDDSVSSLVPSSIAMSAELGGKVFVAIRQRQTRAILEADPTTFAHQTLSSCASAPVTSIRATATDILWVERASNSFNEVAPQTIQRLARK